MTDESSNGACGTGTAPRSRPTSAAARFRLALIPRVSPLPRRGSPSRRGVTLFAAALVGVLAGSAAIGARFLTPPPVPPVVTSQLPSLLPSLLPSAFQSNLPSSEPAAGRIIYTREKTLRNGEQDCTTSAGFCHRANVFIANADGSDERQVVPGLFSSTLLAVSPDGSKVHRPDTPVRTATTST